MNKAIIDFYYHKNNLILSLHREGFTLEVISTLFFIKVKMVLRLGEGEGGGSRLNPPQSIFTFSRVLPKLFLMMPEALQKE